MSRRARNRLAALGVLALIYVITFWIVGLADHLILHPSSGPIPVPNSTRLEIPGPDNTRLEIFTGRTRIRGTEADLAYVLDLSPNAGRAEYGLMYGIGKWEGWPIQYWALNYPGYGTSTGTCSLQNVHRSALAAYDELAKVANGKPIFLSGYSLGTTAALHIAANRPVAGLYLQHPPPLRQLILGKFGWWNLWLAAYPVALGVPPQLDSLANAPRCTAPAFFVLGQSDTFVNYPYQQRVANAYPPNKNILPLPINHNDDAELTHGPEIREGIRWLWQQTFPTTSPTSRP